MKVKRLAACILCFVLGTTILLAGCESGRDKLLDKKNPLPISIWHYYNGAQKQRFDELVVQFNETVGAEKGIVVEAYSQGNVDELNKKVLDTVNHKVGTGEVPDIFASYADTAYTINSMGLVADVGQYLTEEEKASYISEYLSEGQFEAGDSIKLFPVAKSTEVLIINKTDWDKFAKATSASEEGLSTWEGIAALAAEYYDWTDSLTAAPNDGKSFFGRDAMANYIIIGSYQLGKELFQVKNGKMTMNLDKEVMRRLWDNYYVPYISSHYAAIGRFRSDDVKTGDIIALVGSTSGASYFPDEITTTDGSSYPIEAKVYQMPGFLGTVPTAVQQGAGMVVKKSTEQKEYAGMIFLKWFTESQQNIDFSIGSGYMPVKVEANDVNRIQQAIEGSDQPIPEILKEVVFEGVEMTKHYRLYTNKAFENGTAIRSVLTDSLQERADEDAASVKALIEAGISRKDAISRYATDENFDSWYETFAKVLKQMEE